MHARAQSSTETCDKMSVSKFWTNLFVITLKLLITVADKRKFQKHLKVFFFLNFHYEKQADLFYYMYVT